MNRKIISKNELVAFLTSEIQKVPDCESCTVNGVTMLAEPDESGCNWSQGISVRATNADQYSLNTAIKRIVMAAQASFNVEQ